MLTSSRWRTWEYHGRESFVKSSWYARVSSAVSGNIVFQPHYRTDDSKYYAATQVFKSNPSRLYSGLASAILDEQPSAKSTSCIVIDTRDWSVMQETVMNTTTRKSSKDSGARRSNSCISFSHLAVRRITDDVRFE